MGQPGPDATTEVADDAARRTTNTPSAAPPVRRRGPRGLVTVLVLSMLALLLFAGGSLVLHDNKLDREAAAVAATKQAVATSGTGWQAYGTYGVAGGSYWTTGNEVRGYVSFGNGCWLPISAPVAHPSSVTLTILVLVNDQLIFDEVRRHDFPLTKITYDWLMQNRRDYNLGDCSTGP